MIDNTTDGIIFFSIIGLTAVLGFGLGTEYQKRDIANGNYKKVISSIDYDNGIADTTYKLIKIK